MPQILAALALVMRRKLPAAFRPFVDYFAEDKFNRLFHISECFEKPALRWFRVVRPLGLLTRTPVMVRSVHYLGKHFSHKLIRRRQAVKRREEMSRFATSRQLPNVCQIATFHAKCIALCITPLRKSA
jgi:hypothetical protein